jgi:uncharacterized protein
MECALGPTAEDVIAAFNLSPHPEGGHYRETYRDATLPGQRAASTAIYFLLREGEVSRWHKVDAAESWHFYAGAPLLLEMAEGHGEAVKHTLGIDFARGQRPQAVVPPHQWQRARSLGAWTLVGCTVAPGFEFAGFTLADVGFEPGS